MKLLVALLAFCLTQATVQGQDSNFLDNVVFDNPPLDKDAPTIAPDLDKTFIFDGDNQKNTPIPTEAAKPNFLPTTEAFRAEATATEAAATSAPTTATPSDRSLGAIHVKENCTGVICPQSVVTSCKNPIHLAGRCCPICANHSVCESVRCAHYEVCTEHEGRAICCSKRSVRTSSVHQYLHKVLNKTNSAGETCKIKLTSRAHMEHCDRANCTDDEFCQRASFGRRIAALCCEKPADHQPVCQVKSPLFLQQCRHHLQTSASDCSCRSQISIQGLPMSWMMVLLRGQHVLHRILGRSRERTYSWIRPRRNETDRYQFVICEGPITSCHDRLLAAGRNRRSIHPMVANWIGRLFNRLGLGRLGRHGHNHHGHSHHGEGRRHRHKGGYGGRDHPNRRLRCRLTHLV